MCLSSLLCIIVCSIFSDMNLVHMYWYLLANAEVQQMLRYSVITICPQEPKHVFCFEQSRVITQCKPNTMYLTRGCSPWKNLEQNWTNYMSSKKIMSIYLTGTCSCNGLTTNSFLQVVRKCSVYAIAALWGGALTYVITFSLISFARSQGSLQCSCISKPRSHKSTEAYQK